MMPVGAWGGSQPWIFEGRTIWIVDAHGYGKRFIVSADEKLTAFSGSGSRFVAQRLQEEEFSGGGKKIIDFFPTAAASSVSRQVRQQVPLAP